MQRSEGPASLGSNDTAGSKSRSAYRLFPAAGPKPTVDETHRRRSASLDGITRTPSAAHRHMPRQSQLAARRDRERIPDLKPMSTVQELPLDSPTLPVRWTPRGVPSSLHEEAGHGRSSSAPGESLQNIRRASHAKQQSSDHATAHPLQVLQGLGLILPPMDQDVQPTVSRGSGMSPNRHVRVKRTDSSPPPPPPKSPRHHSRNPSGHSRTSSSQSPLFGEPSPIITAQTVACTAVKPTYVHNRATSKQPSKTSSTTLEGQGSYFSRGVDVLTKSIVGGPRSEAPRSKPSLLQKPAPLKSTLSITEQPRALLSPPSSKFSAGSPSRESILEGERTPRAAAFKVEVPSPPDTKKIKKGPSDLRLRDDSAPPSTGFKDFFHYKKRPARLDVVQASSKEGGSGDQVPPPTPLKDYQNHSSYSTESLSLRPGPPNRIPPSRPDSPQSVARLGSPISSVPSAQPSRAPTPEPTPRVPTDRPIPALPFRSSTPDSLARSDRLPDLVQTTQDLGKQTEALHARYASLRSDRLKLSSSIISSLKEHKVGPDYSSTLLDQHLCLAAINSSMDICFAKIKSLECRKEETMNNILAHHSRRARTAISTCSTRSLRSAQSAYFISDVMGEAVTPPRATSQLRKDSVRSDEPEQHEARGRDMHRLSTTSALSSKRNTMIRTSPTMEIVRPDIQEGTEIEHPSLTKLRTNRSISAARNLSSTRDASSCRSESSDGRLPVRGAEDMLKPPAGSRHAGGAPFITVHIPPRSPLNLLPPASPAPSVPLPEPPGGYHFAEELALMSTTPTSQLASASSSSLEAMSVRATSPAESSPEEPAEVQTPNEGDEREAPMGMHGADGKTLSQKVQVLIDEVQVLIDEDEILDAYHHVGRT